ncbi:MAG: Rpn family recombination-promoting nuclease/putative transposase [Bacteroidia bacterium]|nr:Rpn family recombination-promoting nuclease/putative transposase [Bacteroidia bacterium]
MCRINPKIDLVFKKLFGTEKNKDLTKSLINSVLPAGEKLSKITLKNPYNYPDYIKGKLSILDIKAEDERGNLYNVEIQIIGHDDYGKRTLFYWAKIYSDQLSESEQYENLKKTIVISIIDFTYFDNDKRYHRIIEPRDIESHQKYEELSFMSLHFIELQKFTKDIQSVKTTLDRWIIFLNKAHELTKDNIPQQLSVEKEIKKAVKELESMYLDDKEKDYYERQRMFIMDVKAREKGEKIRLTKAISKRNIEIAKDMITNNESIEKITKYTGLSKDEIKRLTK